MAVKLAGGTDIALKFIVFGDYVVCTKQDIYYSSLADIVTYVSFDPTIIQV